MSNDTVILFPNREFQVKGETVVVRPFYFGELPVVVKHLFPILSTSGLSRMLKVKPDPKDPEKFEVKISIPEDLMDVLTNVLTDASEPVMDLLAFGLKKDRSWFNDIDCDVGVELTTAWFEVNRDFFAQRVLPKLAKMIQKNSTGSTLLQSLLEPVIGGQTSTATP